MEAGRWDLRPLSRAPQERRRGLSGNSRVMMRGPRAELARATSCVWDGVVLIWPWCSGADEMDFGRLRKTCEVAAWCGGPTALAGHA